MLTHRTSSFIGRGISTLAVGLLLRILVTYLVTFGNCLTLKDRVFICIAWLPKATVQVGSFKNFLVASARVFVIHRYLFGLGNSLTGRKNSNVRFALTVFFVHDFCTILYISITI